MSGPIKLSRAIAAAAIAGACGVVALAGQHPGSPARIAPPCSPDGACMPRYETWGWYQTRWRPFPTDTAAAGTPTPAGPKQGAEGEEDRGPLMPDTTKEGDVGPKRKRGANAPGGIPAPGGATPEPTLPEGAAPAGAAPPGGIETPPGLPPIEGLPPVGAPPAGAPGTPDAIPNPVDPFGNSPPQPPAWMVDKASYTPRPSARRATVPAIHAVPVTAPPTQNAPNLQGDDAPPALPSGLQGLLGASQRPTWTQAATSLAQPPSVRVAAHPAPIARSGVVTASAETPLGIQLINPASAVAVDPNARLQQAIYFEASDQASADAVQLPPAK